MKKIQFFCGADLDRNLLDLLSQPMLLVKLLTEDNLCLGIS